MIENQLTEIEAAIRMRMSPDLLRWFTRHAPKHGSTRKLAFTEENGEYFYDEKELSDFDAYLREPWPKPNSADRPHVPAGIQREILIESHHKCAFCEYTNAGEGAHIDAVHKSGCNHPHNLIWSCPNHHTEYDFGYKIGTQVKKDHVRVIKELLLEARLRRWRMELRMVAGFISVTEELRKISTYIDSPKFVEVRAELARLAKHTVEAAAKAAKNDVAEQSNRKASPSYVRYAAKIAALTAEKPPTSRVIKETAQTIDDATEEYLVESGLVACPLCRGTGDHNRHRCPICRGDGTVDKSHVEEIDLRPYQQIECPLCEGSGDHNRFECPICFGIGTVDKEADGEIDLRPYTQVKCPLCKGSGDHNRFDCPVCAGVGTIDAARDGEIDLRPYRQVDCPVCKGVGDRNGFECDVCHGVGTVDAAFEENFDPTPYRQVKCPVCDGRGCRAGGQECPPCRGTGRVDEGLLETLDTSLYVQVKCPLCDGRGDREGYECPFCRGSGKVDSGAAEDFDPRHFE